MLHPIPSGLAISGLLSKLTLKKALFKGPFFFFRIMMAKTLSFLFFASLFTILPFFTDLSKAPKIYVVSFGVLLLLLFAKDIKAPRTYSLVSLAFILIFLFSSLGTRGVYSVLYLGVAFLFSLLIYNFYNFDLFCKLHSFLATITACLGIYEYSSYRLLGKSVEMVIPWILPIDQSAQIGGVFGQPNIFAAFLLSTIPSLIFFYSKNMTKAKRSLLQKVKYAPFFVIFACFFLTFSRSGLIVYATVVVFIYFYRHRTKAILDNRELKILSKVFWLSLVALFVAMSIDYLYTFSSNRLTSSLGGTSVVSRIVMWSAGLMMFKDNFWIGVGLHNYRFHLPDYLMPVHDMLGFVTYEDLPYTDWAHNEVVQLVAEGGFLALTVVLFAVLMFFRILWKNKNSEVFYLCLMILVLTLHSMFSWTLRYPTILFLFAAISGLLCQAVDAKCLSISLGKWGKVVLLFSLCTVVYLGTLEIKYSTFKNDVSNGNVDVARFEQLSTHDYLKYHLSLKGLPAILSYVQQHNDFESIKKLRPYSRDLALSQGVHWQWYNYATISLACQDRSEARHGINKALITSPLNEKYWAFLHYLNILDAVDKTGRSIGSFIPQSENIEKYIQNFEPATF